MIIAFFDDLAQQTGALPYRLTDALCTNAFCPAYDPEFGALYWDGNHISVSGARLAVTRFPFDALAQQSP
jgi:hypothetical protein